MSSPKAVLPLELKLRMRHLISLRCGLYFKDHDLKNLEDAVATRMSCCGLLTPAAYYERLLDGVSAEEEFRELLNLLTVNHTYFFRNEAQFQVLKEKILPRLLEYKKKLAFEQRLPKPILRVWSAGCSTGEEPYSLAIILSEAMADIEDWHVEVVATDASTQVLDHARRGVYSENSVKHVTAEYLQKYFVAPDQLEGRPRYEIQEGIKRLVKFGFLNLMDENYPSGFDIIFCRNVVIYFAPETTRMVMEKFYQSLNEEGHLFIGYSESLQFLGDKFKMIAEDDAIYYSRKTAKMSEQEPHDGMPLAPYIDSIGPSREDLVDSLPLPAMDTERTEEQRVGQIKSAIIAKRYSQALNVIEQALGENKNSEVVRYLAAEVYLNLGRFDDGRKQLVKILSQNPLSAPGYYLLGCLYLEEGRLSEAKVNLNKAIYLDGSFLLSHFYLAQVYKEEEQFDRAVKEYRNTLKLLSSLLPTDIIAYSEDVEAAVLVSVCRDNIERLKVDV